jgi:hypothetical protein
VPDHSDKITLAVNLAQDRQKSEIFLKKSRNKGQAMIHLFNHFSTPGHLLAVATFLCRRRMIFAPYLGEIDGRFGKRHAKLVHRIGDNL